MQKTFEDKIILDMLSDAISHTDDYMNDADKFANMLYGEDKYNRQSMAHAVVLGFVMGMNCGMDLLDQMYQGDGIRQSQA